MNFHALASRVNDGPHDIVKWASSGDFSQVAYNISPEPGGGFTVYCPTGREGFFQITDMDLRPLLFATEEAVCDYIWNAIQGSRRPKPAASES